MHDLLDEALLVLGVEDLEALRQAGLAPVQPQQAVRDAVEGADPQRAARHAEQLLDAARASRAAALLVKVTARMPCGEAPSAWITQAMRCVSTRVLPLPAPASTSTGPSGAVTAARCASFRGLRIGDRSMGGAFYWKGPPR